MRKKALLILFSFISATGLRAQQDGTIRMADTMRQNGKIYVVVAVVVTIFLGIVLYLVRLDRKISKLEKNHF